LTRSAGVNTTFIDVRDSTDSSGDSVSAGGTMSLPEHHSFEFFCLVSVAAGEKSRFCRL
jgi:hypothetical protein